MNNITFNIFNNIFICICNVINLIYITIYYKQNKIYQIYPVKNIYKFRYNNFNDIEKNDENLILSEKYQNQINYTKEKIE